MSEEAEAIEVMELASVIWVTKARACELTGLSDGKLRSKMARKWTKGLHYATIDGGTWINIREVQAWITQEASGQCEESSKSVIPLTGSGSKKRSTSPIRDLV